MTEAISFRQSEAEVVMMVYYFSTIKMAASRQEAQRLAGVKGTYDLEETFSCCYRSECAIMYNIQFTTIKYRILYKLFDTLY